jgi:hypothetical protein
MKSAGDERHLVVTQFANLVRSLVFYVFRQGDFPLVVSCLFAQGVKTVMGFSLHQHGAEMPERSAPVPSQSVRRATDSAATKIDDRLRVSLRRSFQCVCSTQRRWNHAEATVAAAHGRDFVWRQLANLVRGFVLYPLRHDVFLSLAIVEMVRSSWRR